MLTDCWVLVMKNGFVSKQGHIIEQIDSGSEPHFIVMWYSWLHGGPTWASIVRASDMKDWRLYDDHDLWRKDGELVASDA